MTEEELSKLHPGEIIKIRSWEDLDNEFSNDEDGNLVFGVAPERDFRHDHRFISGSRYVFNRISVNGLVVVDGQQPETFDGQPIPLYPEMIERDDAVEKYGFTIGDAVEVKSVEDLESDFDRDEDGDVRDDDFNIILWHDDFWRCGLDYIVDMIDDSDDTAHIVRKKNGSEMEDMTWIRVEALNLISTSNPVDFCEDFDSILVSEQ